MALSDRYRDDGVAFRSLSENQQAVKEEIKGAINAGEYEMVRNRCLCGAEKDIPLAEKDCFGIPQRVVMCAECSLIYQDPVLSGDELIRLYESKFRELYGFNPVKEEYFANQRAAGGRIADTVSKFMDLKGKKVLDVGCGTGGVLIPFREKGAEVHGIDIDTEYLSMGKGQGLDLIKMDFLNYSTDKRFDLIIMTDTFEHLPDAHKILEKVRELLSEEGYLFIAVPDVDPFISKFHFLHHLHALHIWYFDRNTLCDLLRSHGMEIVDVCTDRNLEVLSKNCSGIKSGYRKKRKVQAFLKYAVLKLRCTRESLVWKIRRLTNKDRKEK
jgi:2-polyprenyl-3-methyl-5-hydroxy-6-metoxy-1,4-benzoquinol methylase